MNFLCGHVQMDSSNSKDLSTHEVILFNSRGWCLAIVLHFDMSGTTMPGCVVEISKHSSSSGANSTATEEAFFKQGSIQSAGFRTDIHRFQSEYFDQYWNVSG